MGKHDRTTLSPLRKRYCQCAGGTNWFETEPAFTHRIRVECECCGKHVKWGTYDEYHSRKNQGQEVTFIPFSGLTHYGMQQHQVPETAKYRKQ